MTRRLVHYTALVYVTALAAVTAIRTRAATLEPGPSLRHLYSTKYASRLSPLLCEAIRFRTVAGDAQAFAAQQAWMRRVAGTLGLSVRDAGSVTEVELPGPERAPVLGLIVHGDVEKTGDEREWTVPSFAGIEKDGYIYGRGAADDKGPLVQALLAMATIRASGHRLTHTIRR